MKSRAKRQRERERGTRREANIWIKSTSKIDSRTNVTRRRSRGHQQQPYLVVACLLARAPVLLKVLV